MRFGEYLPDIPANENPGLTVAKNCFPHAASYKSFPSPVVYSNALTARAQGAIAVKDSSGNSFNFVGDATTLYKLTDATYSSVNLSVTGTDIGFTSAATISASTSDLSIFADGQKIAVSGTTNNDATHTISGTPSSTTITTTGTPAVVTEAAGASVTLTREYTTDTDGQWEFAQWGNSVIAVNGFTDPPQSMTLSGTSFDDLGGSPPKARHVSVVQNFVVLGNINDGTDRPNRLHWSAINDSTGWTSGTNQSDVQDLPNGGAIQRIVGLDYGVVFCEKSIYRMDYAGYPLVFQVQEMERGRGTPAPGSVVNFGRHIFYLGWDGFYVFEDSQSRNIGANRVDKTFYADLDQSYFDRVSATIDPINTLVFWAYPGEGNDLGKNNKMIVYNWTTDKWAGPIEVDSEIIFSSLSQGVTLDGLGSLYASLDDIPFSLDSRAWQGGSILLSCFDADHKQCNFTGDALTATFETGEVSGGTVRLVQGVRPLFDGDGAATMKVGTRNLPNGTVSWSAPISPTQATGFCDVRISGRYVRHRLQITGGFTHAYGFEEKQRRRGIR